MDPRDKPEDDNCGEPNPLSDVILGLVPRIHYLRFHGDDKGGQEMSCEKSAGPLAD